MLAPEDIESDPGDSDAFQPIVSASSSSANARNRSAFSDRRLRDRTRLVRSVALSSLLTVLAVLATGVMVVSGPPLGIVVVAMTSLGACFWLAQSIDQLNRRQTLWIQWPRESDVALSEGYDADLAELRTGSRKWEVPKLVSLGAACAIGGAWALASGQWAIGSAVWIAMLGCALGASNGEAGSELGFAGTSDHSESQELSPIEQVLVDNMPVDQVDQVEPGDQAVSVHSRCQVAPDAQSSVNADLLVITDAGIDLLEAGPTGWEALGSKNLSSEMTSKLVADAIEGSGNWRDLADIELRRFDAFVEEHGYGKVAGASARILSFDNESIAFAGIYERRYVSGFYFEVELFDGTIDSRNLLANDKRLDTLRGALSDLGYAQRFRQTIEMA